MYKRQGQAYYNSYSTLTKLRRLQTICRGDNSKFRFNRNYSALYIHSLRPSSEPWRVTPISLHVSPPETLLSSMDSDLEAFSHNPTDDSFGALAVQPTPLPNIRTNGSSRTKLDYCRDNQLISRVKLTCLTTV